MAMAIIMYLTVAIMTCHFIIDVVSPLWLGNRCVSVFVVRLIGVVFRGGCGT